ncbi:MAG: DUF4115 domain-containing protein [Betaproteobacteria bacterium]|nr:DUF4115 domain-containing protein [Betaproteobacteria bacterium]
MQPQSDPVVENGPEVGSFDPEATLVPMPEAEPVPLLPPTPWDVLRRAREARGESLNDIARTLKLSAHQLEALENGRFDVLPGPTFVRGFLRNYARYLDIPPEPLLEVVSTRIPTAADLASMLKLDGNVQPKASPRPRSRVLPVMLAVLVALALAAGLVGTGVHKGWFKRWSKGWSELQFDSPAAAPIRKQAEQVVQPELQRMGPEPQRTDFEPQRTGFEPQRADPEPQKTIQFKPLIIALERPVPVNIAPESARDPLQSAQDTESAPGQAPVAVPSVATLRVLFNASTLAQVRDNSGRIIFTRTGTKGSSNSVKGKPPFSIMVKQANNVQLEFNGQAVDLKGHTSKDGIARLTLQ